MVSHEIGALLLVLYPNFVVFFPNFENSPPKIAPNFFGICWIDEVLLDLIHGFAWFPVYLAFPPPSPPFPPQNPPISCIFPRISAQIRPPRAPGPPVHPPLTTPGS